MNQGYLNSVEFRGQKMEMRSIRIRSILKHSMKA